MKTLTSREMVRMLLDRGWYEHSQVGCHRKFNHPSDPRLRAIVPIHPSETLTPGTQHSIMRAAGISWAEIMNRD